MTSDLLTQMESAGSIVTFTNPTNDERAAIIAQYSALKGQGHAIVLSDEFTSDAHTKPFIKVFHYKSCLFCIHQLVEVAHGKTETL